MKRNSPIRGCRGDSPAMVELKESLRSTQEALGHAYTAFDFANDPELTEACIFEIRALQSRMNYLLRQIKDMDSEEDAAAIVQGNRRATWT